MAPWDLAERPTYWRDLALTAEAADAVATRMAEVEARRQERIEQFQKRRK